MNDFQAKVDAALGSVAATTWWWLPHFDTLVHVALALGGIALLWLRIAIAWKEWRQKRKAS